MNARRILQKFAPIALAAGLCFTGPALADELPTITIGAAVTTKTTIGHSSSGIPMEQVTITHRVSYADLDLATQAGAAELQRRVKETARAACKQLDELYPLEVKNASECTKMSVAQASTQVEKAIAASRREAKAQ
ncbi:MAG: UrcA family protein [Gammaproteobacteria bacterium]|nr:UrcA family protein [Gammaproteobacteria bacterium]MDE2263117.1 UrcA family protein [Gammaproteobacteria bacterium]